MDGPALAGDAWLGQILFAIPGQAILWAHPNTLAAGTVLYEDWLAALRK